jgi:hypothetical protein
MEKLRASCSTCGKGLEKADAAGCSTCQKCLEKMNASCSTCGGYPKKSCSTCGSQEKKATTGDPTAVRMESKVEPKTVGDWITERVHANESFSEKSFSIEKNALVKHISLGIKKPSLSESVFTFQVYFHFPSQISSITDYLQYWTSNFIIPLVVSSSSSSSFLKGSVNVQAMDPEFSHIPTVHVDLKTSSRQPTSGKMLSKKLPVGACTSSLADFHGISQDKI